MTGRALSLALLVAVGSVSLAGNVRAQESSTPRRPMTLSERLEAFRRELLGEPPLTKPDERNRSNQSSTGQKAQPSTAQQNAAQQNNSPQAAPRAGSAFAGNRPSRPPAAGANPPTAQPRLADNSSRRSSRRTVPTPGAAKSESTSIPRADTPAVETPTGAPTETPDSTLAAERADKPRESPRGARPTSPSLEDRLAAVRDDRPDRELDRPKPAPADDATGADEPTPAPAEPRLARSEPRAARDISSLLRSRPTHADRAATQPDDSNIEPSPRSVESHAKPGSGESVLFAGQSPRLSVEAAGPKKVLIGKDATFTVTVRNVGEGPANNVAISINIPPYVDLVSARPSLGDAKSPGKTDQPEPFEWRISRLEPRGAAVLTLNLVPRKSTPLDLGMQWTCSPETSQTLVEVQEPKLLIGLSGPDEVLYGESRIYKLALSNPGNGDADNVVINLIPIDQSSEGVLRHRVGTIKAGHSRTIDVELTARQAGAVNIKAYAEADGGLKAEVVQKVLVRRGALKVEVEGPKAKFAGTPATYRINVSNPGNASAENAQLAVTLPHAAKYVSSTAGGRVDADRGLIKWSLGLLKPGAQRTIEVQCVLQSEGENRVQVVAAAASDLNESAAAITKVEALADLKLEVRDPPGPVAVGDEAAFEVVVRNRGTKAAEGVDLALFFSEGMEATRAQGGPHEVQPGQVVFNQIASLPARSEAVFKVYTKAQTSGMHVFRAEVVCSSLKTKLAAEETTHFYGDEALAAKPQPADDRPASNSPARLAPKRPGKLLR